MFNCDNGSWFETMGGKMLRGSILGQGDMDVWEILRLIKHSGFDGYISLEFEGMEPCGRADPPSASRWRRRSSNGCKRQYIQAAKASRGAPFCNMIYTLARAMIVRPAGGRYIGSCHMIYALRGHMKVRFTHLNFPMRSRCAH